MNRIVFTPIIDFPLITLTVAVFIWHFNRLALRHDIETTVNMPARLPAARLRVILLFVCVLAFCWSINLAVWSIFATLLGVGLLVVLATGEFEGAAFLLFAAVNIIREWAFGFPHLILHPPRHEITPAIHRDGGGDLLGKTGVTTASVRPAGEALIDGVKYSVVSFDGGWIEAGTSIEVKTYRNGMPCIAPTTRTVRDGEHS